MRGGEKEEGSDERSKEQKAGNHFIDKQNAK